MPLKLDMALLVLSVVITAHMIQDSVMNVTWNVATRPELELSSYKIEGLITMLLVILK